MKDIERIKEHFKNITQEEFEQNLKDCGFYGKEIKCIKVPVIDKKTGRTYYLDYLYRGKKPDIREIK